MQSLAALGSDTALAPPALPGVGEMSREDFAAALGRRFDRATHAGGGDEDEAFDAAAGFVAAALVEPVLKEMRESSNAPPPWGPGPGEKPFRAMMDVALAERIVRSGNWGLVDRLAREMRARMQAAGSEIPHEHDDGTTSRVGHASDRPA